MEAPAELTLPPDTRYVGLARLVVCTAARKAGLDDSRTEDLRIAVSEATASAMLAHQREGSTEPVRVRFRVAGSAFEVTVADAGAGQDASTDVEDEDGHWTVEGGLGVTLIRGLADEVDYVFGDGTATNLRFSIGLRAEDA